MGIRLKRAETASELDDVFRVRRQIFSYEEGKYGGQDAANPHLVDRFDAHPQSANLVAYDGDEPIATVRVTMDTGSGLPPDELYDFTAERARIDQEWQAATGQPPRIGSAGMLAVREGWRRRRDVVRALFKLAATVGKSWGGTHVLVAVNHSNRLMYERAGFVAVGDKVWVGAIGDHVIPMRCTFAELYARTVGDRLDNVALLKCFSSQFQRIVYRAGETIFCEADEADECYVIDEGSVRITTTNTVDNRELVFAHLGPGEIFGEMALIDEKTRSASATAATDTEVIVLRRDDFMEGLRQNPARVEIVLGFISDRLRRTDEFAKLLAYGSPEQRLEFALQGFLTSAKLVRKPDGSSILRAGPGELAAAAGTDKSEALSFLGGLKQRGYCDYTDKSIRFFLPYGKGRPHEPPNHVG
ncbi:MAG: Crp/Fnr family transcriptional regulator [Gammaproteobacteria bacterium]|nr:Crp/Fnr family transcriptional regulator [Gammaproteobacteria bacterium]